MESADKMHKHSIAIGTTLDESKQHKWLQLQKKYLSCIELLKMRLDRLKKKYPNQNIKISLPTFKEQSFIGTHAKMMFRVLQKLLTKQKERGFYAIKLFAISINNCRLDGYVPSDSIFIQHPKQIYSNLVNFMDTWQTARQRSLRLSMHYMLTHSQNILKIQTALNSIGRILQKAHRFKQQAFTKIDQSTLDPETLIKSSIRHLWRLLNFHHVMQPKGNSFTEQLLQLRTLNQHYKLRITSLNIQFQKQHEQREIETNKKAQGLQQLAEQLREKDQLIEQLQAQIDILKGNATTNTQHSMRSNSVQLVQLQLQSRRLESQLKKIMDKQQKLSQDLQKAQERNRQLSSNLDKALQKISQLQYQCSHHSQIKKKWDIFAQQLNEKQRKLQSRETKCQQIERLMTKVMIFTRETTEQHSQQMLKIQQLIEEFQQNCQTTYQPKTTADALKLVVDIIQSNKPIEYKHFLCFDSLCQNFDQIQQSVIKLKTRRVASPKQSMNGDISEQPSLDASMPRHNRSNPQLTSRLIELELQKKKCEQLVMAEKQKHLIVRQLLLQFIKHLNLKNMTKEAEYTFGILDEMFEFPESEKQKLFQEEQGRKGFFGLFGRN